MNQFSENTDLNREHSFYLGVVDIVHLIFVGAALVILCYSVKRYEDDGGWSRVCVFRLAIAAAVFGYYWRSQDARTGVFYALDLWHQSLLRRRADDELVRAYRSGKQIFKDSREAEVFDGRIVPKPGGVRLYPPGAKSTESHDTNA